MPSEATPTAVPSTSMGLSLSQKRLRGIGECLASIYQDHDLLYYLSE
jgi:hypothetical protein